MSNPTTPAEFEHDLISGFAAEHIARRARQLVGKARITLDEVEDIEQTLRLEFWRRLPRFNPARSPWEAFVIAIIDHCVATLLKKRRALRRQESQPIAYLSTPVMCADHELTELGRLIRPDQQDYLVPRALNDFQEGFCCAHDVPQAVSQLPPELQEVCVLITTHSPAEIARELGLSYSTIRYRVQRIRKIFQEKNLEEYLKGSP